MEGYKKFDGLIFTSGSKIRRGWQATMDAYQTRYAKDPAAMGSLKFGVDTITPVGADGAVVLGTWDLTGSEHPGRGVFSLVVERTDAGWRIVHDHTSSED